MSFLFWSFFTSKPLMYPVRFRTFTISRFTLESWAFTLRNFIRLALRTLVIISAIGSVIPIKASPRCLPARLDHARDFSPRSVLAQADAAHVELAVVRTGPPADRAAIVLPDGEFLRPLRFCN